MFFGINIPTIVTVLMMSWVKVCMRQLVQASGFYAPLSKEFKNATNNQARRERFN